MVRWLSDNWIWLALVGAMVWMHVGMHRAHGAHGAHGAHDDRHRESQAQPSLTGNRGHDHNGSPPRTLDVDAEAAAAPEANEVAAGGHPHRGC